MEMAQLVNGKTSDLARNGGASGETEVPKELHTARISPTPMEHLVFFLCPPGPEIVT